MVDRTTSSFFPSSLLPTTCSGHLRVHVQPSLPFVFILSTPGEYWLPWHIDSQFVTLLTCDEYFDERTGAPHPARPDVSLERVSHLRVFSASHLYFEVVIASLPLLPGLPAQPPAERASAGLVAMNAEGEVVAVAPGLQEDTMMTNLHSHLYVHTSMFTPAAGGHYDASDGRLRADILRRLQDDSQAAPERFQNASRMHQKLYSNFQ